MGDGTESVRRKAKVGAGERYPVPLMDETKIKFLKLQTSHLVNGLYLNNICFRKRKMTSKPCPSRSAGGGRL